jgi:hypothetical protein
MSAATISTWRIASNSAPHAGRPFGEVVARAAELPVVQLEAGLSLLAVLAPDEAASLLQQRLDLLEKDITAQREALARYTREVSRLFLVEVEYDLAIRAAEATWIRGLLDELTIGAFPGVAQWREWHESGPRRGAGTPPPGS